MMLKLMRMHNGNGTMLLSMKSLLSSLGLKEVIGWGRSGLGCSCMSGRSYSYWKMTAVGMQKVNMSTQVTGPGNVELAENYEYDEEEDRDARFSEGGERITRQNKKWLTKKIAKRKDVKVMEYKEIGDSKLDEILETFPQVAEMDRMMVKTVMANSALYGFSPTKTAKMLSRYPEFLDHYHSLLPNSAKAWRRIGIAEKDRVMLFHRFPPLMDLTQEAVAKFYGFLSQYFSTKELVLFIKNNPKCLMEDENSLKNKLDLLWKKYSHSTLSIAKSEAASRTLSQIHYRHEFLIRSGFFKPMLFHKFLKYQAEEDRRRIVVEREKYFPPSIIVCSNDEKFISVCTQNQLDFSQLQTFQVFLEKEEEERDLQEWLLEQEMNEDRWIKTSTTSAEDEDHFGEEDELEEALVSKRDYKDSRYKNTNSCDIFNEKDVVDFFY